jgi:hypothetical protein
MSDALDARAERVAMLKTIIQRLHAGAAPDEVRLQLRTLVRETEATEIASMEQSLIEAGMPAQQVQKMCDLHSQVLREILTQDKTVVIPPGHPVDTFQRENAALMTRVGQMRELIAESAALPEVADAGALVLRWRGLFNELMDIDKHYQRKEHLVFSCLERHDVSGPTQVMWGKDDEVRASLRRLGEALGRGPRTAGAWREVGEQLGAPALAAVEEMVFKEENILFPMCLRTLTETEWAEIGEQSIEYGWCLIEPREGYRPAVGEAAAGGSRPGAIHLPSGSLTLDQLLGIFRTLPVDVTFVDADDRVRFFSTGPDRVFARSAAILGRRVQHCHPPQSVGTVERILDDLRAGRQNVAEFWITLGERFVHIRYFAVRDEVGAYLGTLEVTQDATRIRALAGERRLLQYEKPKG